MPIHLYSQWKSQWKRSLNSLIQSLRALSQRYVLLGLLSLLITLIAVPVQAIGTAPAIQPTITATSVLSPLDQGRKLYASGQFADAIAIWQTAAQSYAASGDRLNQALSLSYLSLAYQALNQWNEATIAIEQSLAILEALNIKGKEIILAQALNTKAGLLLHTGQTDTALETWKRSADLYQQGRGSAGQPRRAN